MLRPGKTEEPPEEPREVSWAGGPAGAKTLRQEQAGSAGRTEGAEGAEWGGPGGPLPASGASAGQCGFVVSAVALCNRIRFGF